MGVIAVEGDRVTVPSMKLLRAGALLAREGVPLDDLLKIIETMRAGVTRAADSLVRLVERYVFDRYGKNNLPPAQEAPRLAELLLQLRPLTVQALDSEVARAMENASDKILGDRLSKVLTHLNKDKGRGRKSGKR
jgi:hypothetical protein